MAHMREMLLIQSESNQRWIKILKPIIPSIKDLVDFLALMVNCGDDLKEYQARLRIAKDMCGGIMHKAKEAGFKIPPMYGEYYDQKEYGPASKVHGKEGLIAADALKRILGYGDIASEDAALHVAITWNRIESEIVY